MNPAQIVRRFFAVATLVAIGLAPGAAFADLKAWNQEEVTAHAKALHVAVKEVRQSMRRESTGSLAAQGRARQRMIDTLRVLEMSAQDREHYKSLCGKLEETGVMEAAP